MIPTRFDFQALTDYARQTDKRLDALETEDIDMSQRRVVNAGKSVSPFDYVIRFELDKLKGELETKQATALKGLLNLDGPIQYGTYALRPAAVPNRRLLYLASDRSYIGFLSIGTTWVFAFGVHSDTFANRPTPTADEIGYRFRATDTAQHFRWTGTAWREEQEIDDAGTAGTLSLLNLIHRTSGTPAAGFGASLQYQLDSSTNVLRNAGLLDVVWTTSTNGSESADLIVRLIAAGSLAEVLRASSNGNLKLSIPGLLQFGGTSSSFPALKRSSTTLQARVADDTAYTAVEVLDEAYNKTNWDAKVEVPTKNAVRDELELRMPGVTAHTIPLAKLTAGGTNGSITVNAYGIVTAYTDPT